MGAMIAVLNKEEENAASSALSMLKELKHRGSESYGVGSPTHVVTENLIDKLEIKEIRSNIIIGYSSSHFPQKKSLQPFPSDGWSFVFEGQVFSPQEKIDVNVVAERIKSNPEMGAEQIIRELKGPYVFSVAKRNKILVGRDSVGTVPLYYGENDFICAVASERKALWKLDLTEVSSFPPGNLATLTKGGFSFKPIKTIQHPKLKSVSSEKAVKHLQKLLLRSTYECVSGLKEVAVAFSGGLDSSLVAVLTKKCNVIPHLISVGLEDHNELQYAKKAASVLNLPFYFQSYTEKDVEKVLPKVLWLIEEPNFVKASIAIPIYWSAELASKLGFKVLLAGQGSDELFGGYHKYLRDYTKAGVEGMRKTIYHDVVTSYETNFQRDEQVCTYHKVRLHLPFADFNLVNYGLLLPVNFKIRSPVDSLRKHILRKVAKKIGLPLFIVKRPKKAIQYSTGASQTLKKLAKKEKLTPRRYIKRVFRTVYPKVAVQK
jgi:asparagine synthase (glutamine-hydrolysing)